MSCILHLSGDEGITLSGPVTRRLLEKGDGDAALLYLCLLRHRGAVSPNDAGKELKWDKIRLQNAENTLRDLALVGTPATETPALLEPAAPTYGREDVANSLESNAEFRNLTAAVEQKLGKKLSTPDISILLGLYQYLGLPIDVIYLLIAHCAERAQRHYGEGRRPGMKQIEKEGYAWARMGLDTQERATEYLKKYAARQGKLPRYMAAMQLGGRNPAPSEEKYLTAWQEMGFSPEAVAEAYDKTMLRCHELRWNYLNGILLKWHEKNLHTVEEIAAGDRAPQKSQVQTPAGDREKAAQMRRYIQKKETGSAGE